LVDKYGKDGLVVIAVNAWDEEKEPVARFVAEKKLKHKFLMQGGDVCDRYGIPNRTIPTVLWIDREGKIVDTDTGSADPEQVLAQKTRALLARK
jgi:hypothetical protein